MNKDNQNAINSPKEELRSGTITFDTGMHERLSEVPKVVADWLNDKVAKYPIDFTINFVPNYPAEIIKDYERVYVLKNFGGGSVVQFLFLDGTWSIRMIGSKDDSGNLFGRDLHDTATNIVPLGRMLGREISGIGSEKEEDLVSIGEGKIGVKRHTPPLPSSKSELVPINPDYSITADLSITGEQFNKVLGDKTKSADLVDSLLKKETEKLKKIFGKDKETH